MSEKSEEWRGKTSTEKREAVVEKSHAPPMTCLVCGVRLMPADMRKHRERCNRADGHELDQWQSENEVLNRGISPLEITRLVSTGALRYRYAQSGRDFLLRDVETFLDARKLYGSALSISAT